MSHPRHPESTVNPSLPLWLDEKDVSIAILWLLKYFHLLQDDLQRPIDATTIKRSDSGYD